MFIPFVFILILFIIILIGALLGSFYLTHGFKLGTVHTPAEVGLEYEEVSFRTPDHLTLRGWLVPGANPGKAVILLHGHGGSIDSDIDYLPRLHAAGYTVLQFDFRGHGRSQGNAITFGYLEQMDVQGAVKFLLSRGLNRIALHGFSLGGMVALTSAPVCPEVAVVIDDGAPIRLSSAVRGWCKERHVPDVMVPSLTWLLMAATSLRFGVNFYRYEPVRWAGKIAPRPLMLIHGDQDLYVPDFDDLLKASQPTQVWRMPAEGHVTASINLGEQYWDRVIAFLKRYL